MVETAKTEKNKHTRKRVKAVVFTIVGAVLLLTAIALIYFITGQYSAQDTAAMAMADKSVKFTDCDDYLFFDGCGDDKALIFYPGAKVDSHSYAPLCEKLAENGTDCFILKIPFNFAFFGKSKPAKILNSYSYKSWYIGGHSLGGVVAGMYADEHINDFDGILLLASYSSVPLTENPKFKALSVYGSNDRVLNKDKMEENKLNLPSDFTEICIQGGNHAQFGDYGKQDGDGEADISAEEQIECVVNAWNDFVK